MSHGLWRRRAAAQRALLALAACSLAAAGCGSGSDATESFGDCGNDINELGAVDVSFTSTFDGIVGLAGGDGRFWIVTTDASVVEIDATTGDEARWFDGSSISWQTEAPTWAFPTAALHYGSQLFVADTDVVVIDPASELTGQVVSFGERFSSVRALSGFAAGDAGLAAIDTDSGSVRFLLFGPDGTMGDAFIVVPNSGNAIDVAVLGEAVYWTDGTGRLRQYELATERSITVANLGSVGSLVAARNRLVVVMSDNQRVASFEPATGALVTSSFGFGSSLENPRLASDGCSVWATSDGPFSVSSDSPTEVCADGCLVRLEPETGAPLAVVELSDAPTGPAVVVADGRVLVVGSIAGDESSSSPAVSTFAATYVTDVGAG